MIETIIAEITHERKRQVVVEGFSRLRDDLHVHGELAQAAACYAAGEYSDIWPFDEEWWKPEMPRRNLIKAAALIVAEIERLDRLAAKEAPEPDPDILREDRDERDRLAREDRD